MNIIENEIKKIAKKHLFLETLERQWSDRLDFHSHGVVSIKAALIEAMLVGARLSNDFAGYELYSQAEEFLKKG